MIAVVDAGPLLALAKVNALDLLPRLYRQVVVSPGVFTETVTAGLAQAVPDADILNEAFTSRRLQVRAPQLSALPIPSLLHRGEDESIRLAIELRADWLIVDDLAARRAALANFASAGAPTAVKGTLGVLVTSYQQGHLLRQQAIDLLSTLKARPDVWISDELCDQAIRTLQAN